MKKILICAALVLFTQIQAAPPTRNVTLAWDRSPDPTVTAYKLRDTLTGQTLALVGNTNKVSIPLAKNKNYNAVVTALNNSGESVPSNGVFISR